MNSLISRAAGLFRGHGFASFLRRRGLTVVPLADGTSRYSGVRLQWQADEPEVLRGAVIDCSIGGRKVRFFVVNDLDEIQGKHRRCEFYEPEELDIISRYFTGGTFVDVGANVGNHSLYALLFLGAKKVLAFEPLPQTARILETNIALNGMQDRFELRRKGLSDREEFGEPDSDPRKIDNLGATRLSASQRNSGVRLVRGDDAIAGTVDFIKIDTEGFELKVLSGLEQTIARDRPALFVEVDNEHCAAFDALMDNWGYTIAERFRRYPENINMMALPSERTTASKPKTAGRARARRSTGSAPGPSP